MGAQRQQRFRHKALRRLALQHERTTRPEPCHDQEVFGEAYRMARTSARPIATHYERRISRFTSSPKLLLGTTLCGRKQSNNPPQYGRRTNLLYFTHVFFSVTCLKLVAFRLVIHHYKHLFLYFYFNTARDVVIVFLISVDVHHFHETFAHMHMYAHINKHTLIIIAQKEW